MRLERISGSIRRTRVGAWMASNALLVAAMVLVVATLSAATGAGAALYLLSKERDRSRLVDAAQIATCEQGNRVRYGGADYTRPFTREAWRRLGFDDLVAMYPDIPAIDCSTGNPVPLPKGAQK
jgi:hypothetical protein